MADPGAGAAPDASLPGEAAPPGAAAAVAHPWRRRHHDLRQPLNALGLFCAALRARPLGVTEQALVQGVADALASLEAMIDAWAAEEAGREVGAASRQSSNPSTPSPHPGATPGPALGAPASPLILVIDDDPGSRFSTAVLLESWGARVTELDGVTALQAWLLDEGRRAEPGLVLADYHLGASGTGLQALDCVRTAYPGARVPAVLITGDEAAISAAGSRPDLTTLRKPVAPQALLDAVGRHVRPRDPSRVCSSRS